MMHVHKFGLSVVLLTAGCAGIRPPIPSASYIAPPAGWRSAQPGRNLIGLDWWTAFGDPVLDRLVASGLANNIDLSVAISRVQEARAQERLVHAQRLPNVAFGGYVDYSRSVTAFGTPQVQTAGGPELAASYDLDLFGQISASDAAAKAALLATAYTRDVVRLAVASSVVSNYVALRSLDAQLEIAEATLADRGKALSYARRRAESGYTSNLEMHQAEAEYGAAERLVPQLKLAVSRQENGLNSLIGNVPGAIERGLPLGALLVPAVPGGLPADLMSRRPDLAAAEQRLVAADHSLDSARAAFLPNISLSGGAGLALSTLLTSPITIWSIGGSILAPLFEGGRLTAQSNIAVSRRDQAAFAYRQTALTAFQQVEDGLAADQRVAEQLAALRHQRNALRLALRVATDRYSAGYAPYLDQLDAQRGLLEVDLAVAQAEADRLIAQGQLYQAMGGGWTG